ncbi:MAG: MarR family transcriptional regulator [Clostridia bacterium]|nr:MarR family transcriptional regulator [Clostridia bacterium]
MNEMVEKLVELRIASRHACSIGGRGNYVTLKVKALYLLSKEPLSPPDLMDKLCMVKSNLAPLCNSLVKDGLIEKLRGKNDRRSITYRITEKGRAKLAGVEKSLESKFNGIADNEEDIEKTLTIFNNMLDLLSFV